MKKTVKSDKAIVNSKELNEPTEKEREGDILLDAKQDDNATNIEVAPKVTVVDEPIVELGESIAQPKVDEPNNAAAENKQAKKKSKASPKAKQDDNATNIEVAPKVTVVDEPIVELGESIAQPKVVEPSNAATDDKQTKMKSKNSFKIKKDEKANNIEAAPDVANASEIIVNFDEPYAIDTDGKRCNIEFDIKKDGAISKISFTPSEVIKLKDVVLYSGVHAFDAKAAFYGDGYQMLSHYSGTVDKIKTITGYTDWDHYKMPIKNDYFTVYNYALIGSGKNCTLIGAASGHRFRLEIRIKPHDIEVVQCLEGIELKANEKVALEDVIILKGEKNKILNIFAEKIAENHPMKTYSEMPVGWCSWYCIGPNISEKKIFDNLAVIKQKTPELKYIQIDDGFQPFMGDWLETSDNFKRPMKDICQGIKDAGFEPAIWLAPFIASEGSTLLREHPEYFVKGADGKPLCSKGVTFSGWRDAPWYMLDGTHPQAQQFIRDTVSEIYHKWGVKYFKLDANTWGALPFGERYDKNATSIEAYRRGMDAIWQATGDDAFILGCNAPMWASLGVVSAMRVTNDVVRKLRHAANLAEQCFNRNWMHKKLWINDPDCLIMSGTMSELVDPKGKAHNNKSKGKFYKLNNIYVRASGGMVLSGDYVSSYTSSDIARLKRILNTDYTAAEFDDNLEIGKINRTDETEYFIFNRKDLIKMYEMAVPEGYTVQDMYNGKPLKAKKGALTFYLTKYGSAWLKLTKNITKPVQQPKN